MHHKKVIICLLLLISVSSMLFAQSDSNWDYYNKPIRDIKFDGLENILVTDVTSVTNRFIGQLFTDELYADLISKIYALDYFSEVEPTAVPADDKLDSVVLRFKVTELPVITKIEYRGNTSIRKLELDESISIKVRDIYNRAKVLMAERAIRDLYLEKGYTNIKISSDSIDNGNSITVIFNVNEGNSTIITSIKFEGNTVVNAKTLKGEMELSEKGLFKDGAFEEAKLERDKQKITDYFQNRGYADAAIIDVRREITNNPEKKRDELTLVFVIREGAVYNYSGTTIVGNTVFDSETLQNLIKIKKGSVFNKLKVQESFMAISDLYYENGYTSNQFIPQQNKDSDSKTVSYSLTIIERERSHIENIIVKGNVKTKDYVITREFPIESGDIFSKAKITIGLRNLFNTQYFSNIIPDTQPGSEDNLLNLIISVEEQSTTSLEFGVTFSGVTEPGAWPVSLFAKWSDSNMLGTGRTVSASVEASKTTQSLSFGLSERWLFGKPITTSVSASVEHNNTTALQKMYLPSGYEDDSYYFSYENWTVSIGASLGKRWTPDFAIISLAGGISSSLLRNIYDTSLYTPVDESISEYSENLGFTNTVYSTVSLDGRDISYDPNKGWFTSERISWTGLIPGLDKQYFFKTNTKLEGYFTLFDIPVTKKWNFKSILSSYLEFTYILPTPNTNLSSRNKAYIDGMFNGRGWTSSKIYNYRGRSLLNGNIEWRFPIVPNIIALDIFGDFATVQLTKTDSKMDYSLENWFFSFGPGIRFCLPQFPLRLLWCNTFQIKDHKVLWGNDGNNGRPEWQFVLSFNLTNN